MYMVTRLLVFADELLAPTTVSDRICLPVSICGLGSFVSGVATRAQDTSCTLCAPGTWASAAGVCDVCPATYFDHDADPLTACEITQERVSAAVHASVSGAVSEADFIAAAAAACGGTPQDIAVETHTQTVSTQGYPPLRTTPGMFLRDCLSIDPVHGDAGWQPVRLHG